MKLLVSIRNAKEFDTVSDVPGVSILDVKDPQKGALGAASPEQLREISLKASNRFSLSCSLGELSELPELLPANVISSLAGYQYVKVGLSGMASVQNWRQVLERFFGQIPHSITRVAVSYADYRSCNAPDPRSIIECAVEMNYGAVLLDTFDKSLGNLFASLSLDEVQGLVGQAQRSGIDVALAGSVGIEELSAIQGIGPTWVAIRGAVCQGNRESLISKRELVRFISSLNSIQNFVAKD